MTSSGNPDAELRNQIEEFRKSSRRLVESGDQALRSLEDGDLQLACDVLWLTHFPVDPVRMDFAAVMDMFSKRGVHPHGGWLSD